MPKSKEYVSSDDDSSEEEVVTKKQQKRKSEEKEEKPAKRAKNESASSSGSSEEEAKPKKKPQKKEEKPAKKQKNKSDDKEDVWELGNNRQVRISEFKGKLYVDIREMYYDKEENLKPGRKGIALNVEQWQKFLRVVEDVNDALKAKG